MSHSILLSLVLSTPGLAQSITVSPDHTGTVITIDGNQYNIHGGTQTGANLFHSFQDFGLSPGEIANFLSNPAIATIFGRVTGGNPSLIHGLIQVTGANSHLYLMNPAGIVFGQGASLNVGGDFVATTADRIGFAEGWFNASGANTYSTLIGAPHQFAFLSANPGAIINAGNLVTGQDLHLIGGTIANSGTIQGDRITLAAVPGNRLVNLAQAGMLLSLDIPQAALEAGITPLDLPSLLTAGAIADPIDPGSVTLNGSLTGTHIDLLASDRINVPTPDLITGTIRTTRFTPDGDNPTQALFIDARADNPEALLFGTAAGTVAQIIERDTDGMAVISEQLADLSDAVGPLESVAIVAEGNQGNFWLGNQWITPETIHTDQTQLQAWSDSLTTGADLLLYSCFTALGATGEALITSLATLTGMDVAASLNATGSSNYGGDWTLETSTGPITASTPFTQTTLDQWDGKLALLTVTDFSDGGGANTLRNLIASAAAGDMVTFAIASTINVSSEVSWATDNLTLDGNGSTIAGTTSSRVFNISANNATVQNITIRDGISSGSGGGILHSGSGLLSVNNAVITNNAASRGGGIESTTGSLRVTNSQITQNSASGEGGGFWNSGALTLTNTTVANNTAGGRGGGIRHQGGTVTLDSSTIAGNSSGSGGGGMFSSPGTVTLNNTTVANNTANGIGGGLWHNGALTLTNSTVAGNVTNSNSGGIFVNTGSLRLTNSTVSGNSAVGMGGGIRSNVAVVSLANTTIAFNTTNDRGGGLYINNPLGNAIANTIIANNTASTGSPDINADLSLSTVQASLITDPSGITGATLADGVNGNIIGQDPLLGPLQNNGGATQTHALLAGSPAINTGENTPALPPTDQTGNPRIADGRVDIGAYEVPEDPVILPVAIAPPPPETPSVPLEETSLPVEELAKEPTEDFTTRAVRDGQSLLDTGVEEIEAGQTSAYQDFATVPPLTLKASQTILKQIAQATGTEPSLLYLTFTPVSLSQTPESPPLLASADPTLVISQILQEPNPLDELQMVLVTSDGTSIVKHSVGVQRRDVVGAMRRLRRQVNSRSDRYLEPAQQLYDWLIRPLQSELQAQGISHLSVIADEGLRSLPLATLHDGQQFLIEQYSTGMMPSLSLVDVHYQALNRPNILAMGASQFSDQNPLPAVPTELALITRQQRQPAYLNEAFTLANLRDKAQARQFQVLHLSTHAFFQAGAPDQAYVKLWGGEELQLNAFRDLKLYEEPPLELLVLSACQTAVGDRGAELGFAGAALQAGVKSVLASLWSVSDLGTMRLMSEFYEQLNRPNVTTKAEALRQAQLGLLRGEARITDGFLGDLTLPPELANQSETDLTHPYYWSAFTLIGSPW